MSVETQGKTGTSRSLVHRSALRADWPLSTENSDIRLGPERPTLPDPQGSDSAGPGTSPQPRGQRRAALAPPPAPSTLTVARRLQVTGVRRGPPTRLAGQARASFSPGRARRGRGPPPHTLALPGEGGREAGRDARRPRPRGAPPKQARVWHPPVRTRGRYLRGRGKGARPAAARNTGTTRSWPAACTSSRASSSARLPSSRPPAGSPSVRPRPRLAPAPGSPPPSARPRPRLRPRDGSHGTTALQQQLYWECRAKRAPAGQGSQFPRQRSGPGLALSCGRSAGI